MFDVLPTEIPERKEATEDKITKVAESTLAQIPTPEIRPFKISFDKKYYKDKECEAHGISKENGSCALKILRDVGVFFVNQNNFLKETLSSLMIIPVPNDNEYSKLYRGLGDDELISEIKYKQDRKNIDLRIFFTLSEPERTFHVVAIRQSHYKTDKF